jgi:DNA-directed RNA polymerase specialized sigma24 family protein
MRSGARIVSPVLDWGCDLPSLSTPADPRRAYFERLAMVREDPEVKRLAHRRAEDPELAKDALQEAYYLMAKMDDPEQVEDLKKYFCKVVIRTVHRLRGQSKEAAVDDAASLADACGRKLGGEPLSPPFDEAVRTNMLASDWRESLDTNRAVLTGDVPGRSPEPDRYRDDIATVAEETLNAIVTGDYRDADLNVALRGAYPEWFAERGVAISNIHQRLARGRADVGTVLRAIITRDELY